MIESIFDIFYILEMLLFITVKGLNISFMDKIIKRGDFMGKFFPNNNRYEQIIEMLCKYKDINKDELFKILKDKNCRYLLFLLLKKYNCTDFQRIKNDFNIKNKNTMNYSIKKAEEKLFINKEFREMYFEARDVLENIR